MKTSITLVLLAGGAPGWKPRFDSAGAEAAWPAGELHGDYTLEVTRVGSATEDG